MWAKNIPNQTELSVTTDRAVRHSEISILILNELYQLVDTLTATEQRFTTLA